jgi:hypothetical protein
MPKTDDGIKNGAHGCYQDLGPAGAKTQQLTAFLQNHGLCDEVKIGLWNWLDDSVSGKAEEGPPIMQFSMF